MLLENELNELLEKVKPISTKGLINIVFLMEQSISTQEYYKIILNLYQLKTLSGTTRIYSWKSNGMLEENIENITKSDINFVPTFVNVLSDINLNGHCLINNKISIPKK